MSTKCTIIHGEGYHLYYECLCDDNVYLEIENPDQFELYKRYGNIPTGVISIPLTIFNKIVEHGKIKSWSGEDPEFPKTQEERNKEFSDGIEETTAWLTKLVEEKKKFKTLDEHIASLPEERQIKINKRAEELKKDVE